MKEVRTEWFVYLHSDCYISKFAFEVMKKHMNTGVGGIEGFPMHLQKVGELPKLFGMHWRDRAYSGFQVFRTKAIQEIIDKMEDDYVYRNEDLVFQNAVQKAGYTYEKSEALYTHYNKGEYKSNEKDAREMSLGLIKYTMPNSITKVTLKTTLSYYNRTYKKINPTEILRFVEENNPKWHKHLKNYLMWLKRQVTEEKVEKKQFVKDMIEIKKEIQEVKETPKIIKKKKVLVKMKCNFCKEPLNPLLLKQASKDDDKLVFDIECVNMKCRKHNWVSQAGYFRLKDDFVKPFAKPINNKLPSEMNVIFVSMERHGISWIIRALNEIHKSMLGGEIIFKKENAEISDQNAKRDDLPLPLGWNNVYEVDPQALINKRDPEGRQYDRIILIERPLNVLLRVLLIKWKAQDLNAEFIEKLFDKTIKIYKSIYEKTYSDARFIRIQLEDLNKYTVVKFNEFLDFLNFPTFGRSPIIPIPIERNWEAYSSILRNDEKICGMLQRIEEMELEWIKKENKI
jgi:CRISPR/Cas system CMR-associated protein Cmr5 small subunit